MKNIQEYNPLLQSHPMEEVTISKTFPSTPSQMEIWLQCYLGGKEANMAYNESYSHRLYGDLKPDFMKEALEIVVASHEGMRAVFSSDGTHINILESIKLPYVYNDISDYTEEEKAFYIEKHSIESGYYKFDLEKGPLFFFELTKISETEHRITNTGHHIIFDGWSSVLLYSHIGLIYGQLCEGKEVFLPYLHKMSDYVVKLQTLSESEEHRKSRDFWLTKLSNPVPHLDLPIDFERSPIRDLRAKQLIYVATPGLIVQGKKFGASRQISIHLLLLSIYEIFLSQWAKNPDVVIGMPRAGQPAMDSLNMIGHSVFLLPIRAHVDLELTFDEYLQERSKAFKEVLEHGTISYGELIQGLKLKRDLSRVSLLPITFNNSISLERRMNFGDLERVLVSNPKAFGNFEILIDLFGTIQNATYEWTYNRSLFKEETIMDAAGKYDRLIKHLIESPSLKLEAIKSMFEEAEPTEIGMTAEPKVNETVTPVIKSIPLAVEMFQNVSFNFSEKIAVTTNDKSITYKELNEQSNRLACLLREKGVVPGDFVGVYLERSNATIIAVMAVLKAGAAYLPIDVEIPVDRVIFMLKNSYSKYYITDQSTFKNGVLADKRIVFDQAIQASDHFPSENNPVETSLENPMYIIYTSGSTGNPKGVILTHKNLNYLITEPIRGLDYKSDDVLLGVTSVSFDMATFEILLPYLFGATVYMLDKYQRKDPKYILSVLESMEMTKMFATPTHWQMMINSGWEKPMSGLMAICAGEPLKKSLVDQLAPYTKEIFNMYGPTETTVFTNLKKIDPSESQINIGKEVSGTTIYFVDKSGKLVTTPNVSGEIWIGGDCVGKGYLGMDELNSEKFIQNPFAEFPERIFRSGDLGHRLTNGDIQCDGRLDYQVKIRGHRIELGEIEQRILQSDEVSNAVVLTEDSQGFVSLIAFISLKNNYKGHIVFEDFQEALRERLLLGLPEYMIPSDFRFVEEFNLTTSGKIDRLQLINNYSKLEKDISENTHTETFSDDEQRVYSIWTSVLGNSRLTLDSDFFLSGGHSLLGVKLISLLEKEFNVSLTLLLLFQFPTIRTLTARITQETKDVTSDSLILIKKGSPEKVLCFVHGVGLNPIEVKMIVENMGEDHTIYGLQSPAISGNAKPFNTIPEMASHYIQELKHSGIKSPYNLIGNSIGGLIVYEMAKQLKSAQGKVGFVGMIDTIALCYYEKPKDLGSRLSKSMKKLKFEVQFLLDDIPYYVNHRARYIQEKWNHIKGEDKNENDLSTRIKWIEHVNRKAWECYTIEPIEIDITLFLAERKTFYVDDFETLGWSKYTRSVERYVMPGEHSNMLKPPHGKEFTAILKDKLNSLEVH